MTFARFCDVMITRIPSSWSGRQDWNFSGKPISLGLGTFIELHTPIYISEPANHEQISSYHNQK
jgi:hypothetical protein